MLCLKYLVWLFTVFLVNGKGNCTVFLQSTASVSLPCDFPVGATFFRLQPLDEVTGKPIDGGLIYHVLKSVAFPSESKSGRGLFTVDEHTGSLMLSPHRRHSLAEYKGSTFALDIVALSSVRPSDNTTHATIVITITRDNFSNPNCYPREHMCFSTTEIQLQLPETVPYGTSLDSLRPIPFQKLCPEVEIKYSMESDALLAIDVDGNMKTVGWFDFEKNSHLEYNVSCDIADGNATRSYHSVLQIFVLDVDDNAPYVQDNAKLFQELDLTQVIPGKPLPTQLTVLDADTAAVNNITVSLNDPMDLFNLRDPVLFHGVNGTHMLINTALVPKSPFYFPKHSYGVLVTFTDNSLIPTEQKNQVQFHVRIVNHSLGDMPKILPQQDFEVVANVFRHSSRHARIIQPMEVKPHEGYFFRLVDEPDGDLISSRIFGVTPETGIVYVKDEASLAKTTKDLFELQLTWRNREEMDRKCSIKLKVLDAGDPSTVCGIEPGHHFPTCALHATSESCTSSCGRGAVDGFCRWRAHISPPSLTTHYATCSPHLATCPDGVCDELEEIDPMICPQDCAANVRGEAVQGPSGKGVGLSAAPCTCTSPNTCVCVRFYPRSQRVRRPAARNRNEKSDEPRTVPAPPLEFQDEWTECGSGCAAMIGVVSLIVTGLIVSATLLVCKRRGMNSKGHDFPSVTTPLNPTAACRTETNNITPEDDRLEFPRSRLSLEDTLGEGEFGRVVKGRAWDIAGIPGVTTVAVKMLKEGSSPSEKGDLITELNLLKEISHPNVVRLLGACTDEEGPLYVIMEFAEHGSLITFLRKMRARYPHVQGEIRELISFAWQIAKGMEYLAENKVVHRDLAARNVLVATGRIMKISDFGLSRDVYEKDAYLKTTKGRVPYKWMAMESLQNHLYTTKSDVWSFGILLWEIITLGGCPYPGIPAENLFRLLKEGYRMPRPDDCPIQIYQLMTICWREKPHERPHFKDLVRKLEFLLNDSMHYLPMRDEERQPPMKKLKPTEETSLMTQITFPKMSTVAIGPYENRRLLSPTEYSV